VGWLIGAFRFRLRLGSSLSEPSLGSTLAPKFGLVCVGQFTLFCTVAQQVLFYKGELVGEYGLVGGVCVNSRVELAELGTVAHQQYLPHRYFNFG